MYRRAQVLDDFDRGNQTGLGSPSVGGTPNGLAWTTAVESGNGSLDINGNAAASPSPNDSNYISTVTFGPNIFGGFTLSTDSTSVVSSDGVGFYWNLQSPGGAGVDGYEAYIDGAGNWKVDRINDSGFTTIINVANSTASGDRLDVFSFVNTTGVYIELWKNETTLVSSFNDTAANRVGHAGFVGLQVFGVATDWRIGEFRASTYPGPSAPLRNRFPKIRLRR